jgi:hypothetical protein
MQETEATMITSRREINAAWSRQAATFDLFVDLSFLSQ